MKLRARSHLAKVTNTASTVDGDKVTSPYWKFEQDSINKRNLKWSRHECLASLNNRCAVLFPLMSSDYNQCNLGIQLKQGTLPLNVRSTFSQSERMEGIEVAIGYSMPLCPLS